MAKKQSMNIFEAHIEKVFLGIAAAVMLWVIYSSLIKAPGVEFQGQMMSPPEATQKAVDIAQTAKNKQLQTPPKLPTGENLGNINFIDVPIFVSDNNISLSPPRDIGQTKKIATQPVKLPAITGLTDTALGYYQTVTDDQGTETIKEIDFVSLEATLPLAQIKSLFKAKLVDDPQITVPVKFNEPVFVAVDLQRSRLLPDGSWAGWESVDRLAIDPMAEKKLRSRKSSDYSNIELEVLYEQRKNPGFQISVLQPPAYPLLDGSAWLSPIAKAKLKKEQELEAQKAARPQRPTRVATRSRGGETQGRPPRRGEIRGRSGRSETRGLPPRRGGEIRGMPGRGEGIRGMIPGRGEEIRGMTPGRGEEIRGMTPGRGEEIRGMTPGRGVGSRGNVAQRSASDAEKLFENEQIKIWAHDEGVQPGGVYRYRIKVGVFNPLAGTDRFTPEQKNLQNDVILWSAPVVAQKMVRIPERIAFFPKSGSADQAVASFDVFRRHQGRWYTRSFSVTPGVVLGQLSVPKLNTPPSTTPIQMDFCTNATILDIIPNCTHWYRSSSAMNSIQTTDIIIQLDDGTITRLYADKRCWTQQQKEQHSGITKKIREAQS